MGSVKDILILRPATEWETGIARFVFSDRYSVFDYGEMPDKIKNKGKALCITSAYFFEKAEEKGIKTHYLGVVENNKIKKIDELEHAGNIMEIRLLRVIKPEIAKNEAGKSVYDYSVFRKMSNKGNFLIPLEVIYRNIISRNSSLLRRLKEGRIKPAELSLAEIPEPEKKLESPIIELSTKFEERDRYISWDEAREIANISEDEINEIRKKTLDISKMISNEVEKLGILNEDGKFEFGFDESRKLIVADAIGTLDECRFSYNSFPVSKEIARIYYRATSWYREVERAKKKDSIKWRAFIRKPPKLNKKLAELISLLYQSFANELTGKEFFDAPKLKDVISELREIQKFK